MITITHDKMPEDIGIGIGIRMKTDKSLSEVLFEPPKIAPGVQVQYVREIIHIEPPLTWTYWWSFTKRLVSHTWRKIYGTWRFHRKG